MCSVLRLMHMLCVKDVLLKMFLYMRVKEICNFALCLYGTKLLGNISGLGFFSCSPGESFVISKKIK